MKYLTNPVDCALRKIRRLDGNALLPLGSSFLGNNIKDPMKSVIIPNVVLDTD
jgi:hypothetical protein